MTKSQTTTYSEGYQASIEKSITELIERAAALEKNNRYQDEETVKNRLFAAGELLKYKDHLTTLLHTIKSREIR